MPSLFSRIRGKDGQGKSKKKKTGLDDLAGQTDAKQRWDDAYARTTVEPEEIANLVRCCTAELKARGMSQYPRERGPGA